MKIFVRSVVRHGLSVPMAGLVLMLMVLGAQGAGLSPATALGAQDFTNPVDPLYQDLEIWARKGILDHLPLLRPYNVQTLVPLLDKVIASDRLDEGEKARAKRYRARVGDGLHAGAGGTFRSSSTAGGPYAHVLLDAEGGGMLTDWASVALGFKLFGLYRENGLVEPEYGTIGEDYYEDWADAGGLELRQGPSTQTGFGTVDGEFQAFAGFTRQSFGPFFSNGVVAGPQARASGRFSASLDQGSWDFTIALFELGATDNGGGTIQTNDTWTSYDPGSEGDWDRSSYGTADASKHMFFHYFTWRPAAWVEVGLFETVLTGSPDALYMLPLCSLFQMQGMGGFQDNSLMGIHGRVQPMQGLDVKALVYADDLHFNDIVKLDFDTKWKLAWQGGVSWSPVDEELSKFLRQLDLDYTAVMPYMYTHSTSGTNWAEDDAYTETANYTNYTHFGECFGADLLPNSQRVSVKGAFDLIRDPAWGRLQADLGGLWIVHGNAAEGLYDDEDWGTGDYWDTGYDNGTNTFQHHTRFLTQSVLEHTLQASLDVSWILDGGTPADRGWGVLGFGLGYTWEHVWNKDLSAGVQEDTHYIRANVSWTW